ncbi:hypothetical protein ID866_10686 [Astraeus odoratus]|nr:hypothetical protein ID866_10686 [Astraeus odoratus]
MPVGRISSRGSMVSVLCQAEFPMQDILGY